MKIEVAEEGGGATWFPASLAPEEAVNNAILFDSEEKFIG